MEKKPIRSLQPRSLKSARRPSTPDVLRARVRRASHCASGAVRTAGRAVPQQEIRRSGRITTTAFIALVLFGSAHVSAAPVGVSDSGLLPAQYGAVSPELASGTSTTLTDLADAELVPRPTSKPALLLDYLHCPSSGVTEVIDLQNPTVQEEILDGFFAGIEARRTPDLDSALLAWVRAEGWDHGYLYNNNPLAMRVSGDGVCGRWNSAGVGIISSLERGVELAAMRLTGRFADVYNYEEIVAAARLGNPALFLRAIARSQWNAPSHYGCGEDGRGSNYLAELWSDVDPDRPRVHIGC